MLSVVIGIATSLGFGTLQVNSGMNYLWGLPISIYVQIGLIAIITVVYIASTISGLQGAINTHQT